MQVLQFATTKKEKKGAGGLAVVQCHSLFTPSEEPKESSPITWRPTSTQSAVVSTRSMPDPLKDPQKQGVCCSKRLSGEQDVFQLKT